MVEVASKRSGQVKVRSSPRVHVSNHNSESAISTVSAPVLKGLVSKVTVRCRPGDIATVRVCLRATTCVGRVPCSSCVCPVVPAGHQVSGWRARARTGCRDAELAEVR